MLGLDFALLVNVGIQIQFLTLKVPMYWDIPLFIESESFINIIQDGNLGRT